MKVVVLRPLKVPTHHKSLKGGLSFMHLEKKKNVHLEQSFCILLLVRT